MLAQAATFGGATFGGGGSSVAGFDINVVTLAVLIAVLLGYAVVYRIGHRDGRSAALSAGVPRARFGLARFAERHALTHDEHGLAEREE